MTLRYQRLSLLLIVSVLACSTPSCSIVPARPDQKAEPKYLYKSVIFDIAAIQSCQPSQATFDFVRGEIAKYEICKKENVIFRVRDIRLPIGKPPTIWTHGDLFVFLRFYGTIPRGPTPGRRYMFVGYVRGIFIHDRVRLIAGIQLLNHYFIIFKDGAHKIEPGAFLHEFLHALGLRKTTKKPFAHCPNKGCLMHPTLQHDYHYLCDDCMTELKDLRQRLRSGAIRKLY